VSCSTQLKFVNVVLGFGLHIHHCVFEIFHFVSVFQLYLTLFGCVAEGFYCDIDARRHAADPSLINIIRLSTSLPLKIFIVIINTQENLLY
jgi:hypothetical protein